MGETENLDLHDFWVLEPLEPLFMDSNIQSYPQQIWEHARKHFRKYDVIKHWNLGISRPLKIEDLWVAKYVFMVFVKSWKLKFEIVKLRSVDLFCKSETWNVWEDGAWNNMKIRLITFGESCIREQYLPESMEWNLGNMGSLNLWSFETKKPRNWETKTQRNQETTESRNHETKKPNTKEPRNQILPPNMTWK